MSVTSVNANNEKVKDLVLINATTTSTAIPQSQSKSPDKDREARIVGTEEEGVYNGINTSKRKKEKEFPIKKQVVMGREFKGAGFISFPERIEFKDFEVGQTYQTKVSCGFCHSKANVLRYN